MIALQVDSDLKYLQTTLCEADDVHFQAQLLMYSMDTLIYQFLFMMHDVNCI